MFGNAGPSLPLNRHLRTAAAAMSRQSCPTQCNPIDGSPPGSPVPGILQARTVERVAISSSNAWKWKVKGKSLSRARLLATPWTAAYQAPPSMGFSRREYWSGVPSPSPTWELVILYTRKPFYFLSVNKVFCFVLLLLFAVPLPFSTDFFLWAVSNVALLFHRNQV